LALLLPITLVVGEASEARMVIRRLFMRAVSAAFDTDIRSNKLKSFNLFE